MGAHFQFPFPKKKHNPFCEDSRLEKRSYPLEIEVDAQIQRLSFAFVEIGCRHNKKRSQLKDKKELFLKYWGDTYRSTGRVDWMPQVFRIMSHFAYLDRYPREPNKYSVDIIIHHKTISLDMIPLLQNPSEINVKRLVKSRPLQDSVNGYIKDGDIDGLHNLITFSRADERLGTFRGALAEYLSQKTIESVLDTQEMVQYNNGSIMYFNKKFPRAPEIDQILQFHGIDPFYDLIDRLSALSHIDIIEDTPRKNRYIHKAV